MTQHDRWAIVWREILLLIPIGLAMDAYHYPEQDGFWFWLRIIIIPVCIMLREGISYNWLKRGASLPQREGKP